MSRRHHFKILVCRGPECGDKRNSIEIYRCFQRLVAARALDDTVELGWQSCFGRCTQGPNVLVREVSPGQEAPRFALAAAPTRTGLATALYNRVTVARATQIADGHLVGGQVQRQFIERPAVTQSTPTTPGNRPRRETPE